MKLFDSFKDNDIYIVMIDRIEEVNNKEICIAQDLSLSHAGTVWDGAIVMLHYWNKNSQIPLTLFEGKRVLQVGSGTGIVGIASAAYNPKKVYLTDLPQYLKILEINRSKNEKITENQDCIKVAKLQWGNQQDIDRIQGIDTLIGSELAYDKEAVKKLMNTICYYKKVNPELKVMISYQKYKQEWKNLEIMFSEYFGKERYGLVEWHDFDEDYRDEHIGILYMN